MTGLKDKASRINFSTLPSVTAASENSAETPRPKTAPGAMMAFAAAAKSDLLIENEQLRLRSNQADQIQEKLDDVLTELKGWDGAKATRQIDPARIVRSRYANRHELNFNGPEFIQLKNEIESSGGNVQPIKVRAIASTDSQPMYEIVFGHRRHEACRQLRLNVLAVVDNLDDRAMFIEMDRENRGRKDLSAWEQGVMYRRALDSGLFTSNRKMAEAIGVDLTNLGKALSLANLPNEVIEAFKSPLDLQFRWAKPLHDALKINPQAVLERAKEVKAMLPKAVPADVFRHLIGSDEQGGSTVLPPIQVEVNSKRAATITLTKKGGATIIIEPGIISPKRSQDLVKALKTFLATSESLK